ncbi:hypothetical protein MIND_01202700 [Mycena indigotica]|uniref:Uncharacterized protein n=1 Tax=Mycena indigotica TaxID=2126181 RepID=A0A8H6S646_9AGAR|nr:uncharacterized protein MIND_01202700 [Mycena indigotica]KAF7293033.1 hypothetical protein MIND_01202700 [Mycena indigotica]
MPSSTDNCDFRSDAHFELSILSAGNQHDSDRGLDPSRIRNRRFFHVVRAKFKIILQFIAPLSSFPLHWQTLSAPQSKLKKTFPSFTSRNTPVTAGLPSLTLSNLGYTPAGKPIFQAPAGSSIRQSGEDLNVFAPDGTLIHVLKSGRDAQEATHRSPGPYSSAEALAVVNVTDVIQSLTATFTVPPEPKTFDSQLFFFGAGIGIDSSVSSLSPLMQIGLQYGGTPTQGGSFWSAIILLEDIDGTLVQIGFPSANPILQGGDRLTVSITRELDREPAEWFWYTVAFDHLNLPFPLTAETVWQNKPPKALLKLEEYGVVQASEYPSGTLVFENVNINTTTGGFPSLSWQTSAEPATNIQVNVERDGSQNARIAFQFPENV